MTTGPLTVITRNATGSGGLGRYERALLTALAEEDVRHIPAQPWPVPSPVVKAARLVRVDLTTILRGKRSFVPGPRTEGIYHLTNHELAVSLRWQRYQAPTVVTVHDLITLTHSPPQDWLTRILQRQWIAGLKRATGLIAVSQATKDQVIIRLGIPADRISVVHHTIDNDRFVPGGEPDDPPFVLYVGSALPHKDIPTLLQAVAMLRISHGDVRLVIAGSPRLPDASSILAALDWNMLELGIAGATTMTGPISDDAVADLYRRATVTVLPSRAEGFGFPVLEAMASGCPVIVSDATALTEVAGDAALVFPVGDAEALRARLDQVMTNAELRTRLRTAGLERAATFNSERFRSDTVAAYDQTRYTCR